MQLGHDRLLPESPDAVPAALPQFPHAPVPVDEAERLRLLHSLGVLDTPRDAEFDRLVYAAAQLFRAPIALLSLVDRDRQWFKAKVGLSMSETPRSVALCAHAILSDKTLLISDASGDERFARNPLVTGKPSIRFYAGAPLIAPCGRRLGTLCVIDVHPRHSMQLPLAPLARLAASATDMLLAGR